MLGLALWLNLLVGLNGTEEPCAIHLKDFVAPKITELVAMIPPFESSGNAFLSVAVELGKLDEGNLRILEGVASTFRVGNRVHYNPGQIHDLFNLRRFDWGTWRIEEGSSHLRSTVLENKPFRSFVRRLGTRNSDFYAPPPEFIAGLKDKYLKLNEVEKQWMPVLFTSTEYLIGLGIFKPWIKESIFEMLKTSGWSEPEIVQMIESPSNYYSKLIEQKPNLIWFAQQVQSFVSRPADFRYLFQKSPELKAILEYIVDEWPWAKLPQASDSAESTQNTNQPIPPYTAATSVKLDELPSLSTTASSTTLASVKKFNRTERQISFPNLETAALEFNRVFQELGNHFQEREYLIDVYRLGLLLKANILLLGSAGNGKSAFNEALGQMITGGDFSRITMNQWVNPGTIFGPTDWAALLGPDKIMQRLTSEGVIRSKGVFFDEIFDPRPEITDLLLEGFAERSVSDGAKKYKVDWHYASAATNIYLNSLVKRYGITKARRMIDRFQLLAWVPHKMSKLGSYEAMDENRVFNPKSKMSWSNIEALSSAVEQVYLPPAIRALTVKLFDELDDDLKDKEAEDQRKAIDLQDDLFIPFMAHREFSPRSNKFYLQALRAIAFNRYLLNPTAEAPEVTLDDLNQLKRFITMTGPERNILAKFKDRSKDPIEKRQLEVALIETDGFQTKLNGLKVGIASSKAMGFVRMIEESPEPQRKDLWLRLFNYCEDIIQKFEGDIFEMNKEVLGAFFAQEKAAKELGRLP